MFGPMKFIKIAMLGGIAFCFSDLWAATAGDDIIVGGAGNDLLHLLGRNDEGSGAVNDTLFDDDGSDTLLGDSGRDFLIGGTPGAYGDTAGNILSGVGDDDFLIDGAFGEAKAEFEAKYPDVAEHSDESGISLLYGYLDGGFDDVLHAAMLQSCCGRDAANDIFVR